MNDFSDRELIRQFVAGTGDEAFSAIVARYAPMVYHSALRQVGDWPTAQDVTQAVFIVLWNKAAGLRDAAALPAWLLSVTRLVARDTIKRRAARNRTEQLAVAMNKPDEPVNFRALSANLDWALASLTETDRTAVAMRYLSGMSFKQVGTALGVSDEAAKKRTVRALEKLRAVLSRRGVSSPADLLENSLAQIAMLPVPAALATGVLHATRGSASVAATLSKGILMASHAKTTVAAVAVILALVSASTVGVIVARKYISADAKPSISLAAQTPATQPAAPPASGEYYVGGKADRTGPYGLAGRHVTLREALVAAGLSEADTQTATVQLIHRPPAQQGVISERSSEYKLQDILELRVAPVELRPMDMIIVK